MQIAGQIFEQEKEYLVAGVSSSLQILNKGPYSVFEVRIIPTHLELEYHKNVVIMLDSREYLFEVCHLFSVARLLKPHNSLFELGLGNIIGFYLV